MGWSIVYSFLFGASAGSILTALFRTGLDELRSIRDNKRQLRKIFFEHRLQIAETAINNWQHSIDLHARLIHLFDIVAEKKEDNIDMEFLTSTFESIQNNQEEVSRIRAKEGYKILAYHDIGNVAPWNSELDTEYTTLLGRFSFESGEVKRFRDMSQPPGPGVDWNVHQVIFNFGKDGVEKHTRNAREICKRLSEIGLLYQQYYRNCINVLRNQIYQDIK